MTVRTLWELFIAVIGETDVPDPGKFWEPATPPPLHRTYRPIEDWTPEELHAEVVEHRRRFLSGKGERHGF